MRYRPVLRALGLLLMGEAVFMVPSLIISLIYGDNDHMAFIYSIIILAVIGFIPSFTIKNKVTQLYTREGFALVGLGWILLSLFGMLPFIFSGVITNPIDALFETVSGFTTTGASILSAIEGLPHGILFWRSFTHWVGGMGVLILTIALLPQMGLKNMEVLKAESPGPTPEKLVPRIRDTAKMLYLIYLGMSLILFILLVCFGMKPYDAAVNTFGTAGTGGFSILNASIGGYNNPAFEVIIGIFMLLFGVSFSVYFMIVMRQWKRALKNQEMIFYFCIAVAATVFITIDIFPRYANFWESLRYSFFQVSSVMTTTGYATTDFNQWPVFSKCLLLFLMLIGASAGSTGGGVKVVRLLASIKVVRRELYMFLHPRSVRVVSLNKKALDDSTVRSVLAFMFLYILIILMAALLVALDGFDFETTLSSVVACISNIGPGMQLVGPMGNYADFSILSKIVLSFCMLIGRLEIMPILLLFSPSLWRKL